MEYIIIGLLILIVILVTVSLMKNINEGNITERLGKLETGVIKELGEFKNDLTVNTNNNFNVLNEKIERKLNMFIEYTMASETKFGEDFGFSEAEVDMLYQRYQSKCIEQREKMFVTREGLRTWYDGYNLKLRS